jgi:hypothetical protein
LHSCPRSILYTMWKIIWNFFRFDAFTKGEHFSAGCGVNFLWAFETLTDFIMVVKHLFKSLPRTMWILCTAGVSYALNISHFISVIVRAVWGGGGASPPSPYPYQYNAYTAAAKLMHIQLAKYSTEYSIWIQNTETHVQKITNVLAFYIAVGPIVVNHPAIEHKPINNSVSQDHLCNQAIGNQLIEALSIFKWTCSLGCWKR